jgi:hypothetical protein
METHSSCWLVTNPGSGSNTPESTESLRDDLLARGISIEREIAFPEDDLPTLSRLDRAGARLVVTYAGDGTVNAVLSALEGWGGAVLVLPGGTMNLLSRRLHGELEIGQILDLVAAGSSRPVRASTVTCEGGTAYAGLLVGPGTCWNRVRESMRNLALADMAAETIEAIGHTATGPQVTAPHSRLAHADGYPLIELTPGEHGIQIDGYRAEDPLEFAEQAWAVLRRRFRDGPHDRLGVAEAVELASIDGSPLACLFDGEPSTCPSPFRFTVEPCGVDLLASAHDI